MIEVHELTTDAIAMELTVATIEPWLNDSEEVRNGETIGREIAAMYREIHSAVAEMHIEEENSDLEDLDEEDDLDDQLVDSRS